ncbi:MAG: hypothetical protein U1F83_05950 [Verrucomicrobiota bacterium]
MKTSTTLQRRQMEVWPQAIKRRANVLEASVRLETRGVAGETLWYRLPAEHETSLPESLDPFVIGTLFVAMRRAMDLRVHGRVSPSLLRNLEEFQAAWHCWHPERYHRIEIRADTEREEESANNDRAVMMFSGGLDSCFTAWRHTQKLCGRRSQNLDAAVMVHGFDIPLEEPEVFRRAAENSRKLAESVGLELIPVACNFRQLGDDWEQEHGAGLASCLHLLCKRYATGLIAGSHVYNTLRFPWGSNPLTDGLLSSASLAIVYDGGDFSRREKAREVAAWHEAMARLRVCWEGEHKDRNCGKCLRCVGTAICFAVEGQPIPASLPVGPLQTAIQALGTTKLNPVAVARLEELLAVAKVTRINESWVIALEDCVRRQLGATETSWARLTRKLRQGIRDFSSATSTPRQAKPHNRGFS